MDLGENPSDLCRWQNGLWEPVEYEQLRVGDLIRLCEDKGCVTRVVTEVNPHFVAFSRTVEGVMTDEQRAKLVGVEEEGRVLVFSDGGRWRLPEGFSAGGRFTKESSFYPYPLTGFLLKATGMKRSIELHANDQVAYTRAAIEDVVGGLAKLLRAKHVP